MIPAHQVTFEPGLVRSRTNEATRPAAGAFDTVSVVAPVIVLLKLDPASRSMSSAAIAIAVSVRAPVIDSTPVTVAQPVTVQPPATLAPTVITAALSDGPPERKSVVSGERVAVRVDLGGGRSN